MSDIKMYKIINGKAIQLEGRSATLERKVQRLIEDNLETLLGVRFLGTEYSTGAKHRGRIDTIGLDENGCPVIIEYKRTISENVINQGLFYFDWLLDHKAEFKLLVMDKLGQAEAEGIEWTAPRLLCIAGDFSKYDIHAVEQINRNIELIRYAHYGDELLMLELINNKNTAEPMIYPIEKKNPRTIADTLTKADKDLTELYESFDDFARSLGDDVQTKALKFYFVYKRLKNFACVELYTRENKLVIYIKGNPQTVPLEEGLTRDVTHIGHYGTGNIELTIRSPKDLERVKPLIVKSYEDN